MNDFDDRLPPGERIPRRLEVTLSSETCPQGQVARMTVNGFPAGDPLTDGGWIDRDGREDGEGDEDVTGARWHDVLHLAHAVCLGWSPVLRGLTGRRRRSDPRLYAFEDGAQAVRAEEAVAWAVFRHARRTGRRQDAPVDAQLLALVRELSSGFEVSARSDAEWTHTIRTGVACLHAVRAHNGGVLLGDLTTRSLLFRPPVDAADRTHAGSSRRRTRLVGAMSG
ncbi:hypothetical protein [Kitasatospora sp. NPDC057015]|uniref:hypothetical protein n=1 Tax=Kitasatospora sp. NPDC057015 TaxID=3346001 RepID=UPI00363B9BC4